MIKTGKMTVYDTIQTQTAFWLNVFFKYAEVVCRMLTSLWLLMLVSTVSIIFYLLRPKSCPKCFSQRDTNESLQSTDEQTVTSTPTLTGGVKKKYKKWRDRDIHRDRNSDSNKVRVVDRPEWVFSTDNTIWTHKKPLNLKKLESR